LSEFLPINAKHESRNAAGNLQAEMSHCLRAAGAEVDGELALSIYDVRRQYERKAGESVTLEKAVQETTKYLTKSESWDKIPDSQLVKVAEVERWPRMFELLGKARLVQTDEQQAASIEESESATVSGATLVHTPCLSNGDESEDRAPTWRQMLAVMDLPQWKRAMDSFIRRAQRFRRTQLALKFPYATFETLSGEEWSIETIDATPTFRPS
jgi:hypothetical protein